MFGKKYFVIAIKRGKIIATNVKTRGKKKVLDQIEYGWDEKTLDIVISKIIADNKPKSVRILLGEELSYVLRLSVPLDLSEEDEREYIGRQISNKIPEILTDRDWDYKDLHFNIVQKKQTQKSKEVIVFSPVKGVFDLISSAIRKAGVKVDAVEPEQIARIRDKNPLVGIAKKVDLKGDDKDVLNIKPLDVRRIDDSVQEDDEVLLTKVGEGDGDLENEQTESVEEIEQEERSDKEGGSRKQLFLAGLMVVLFIIAGVLVYFLIIRKGENEIEVQEQADVVETTSPTQTPIPEEEPEEGTDEVVELETYKLQIQNGSGIEGEARIVNEILIAEGFSEADTENAPNYDYVATEVKFKQRLPQEVYETVERALNSDYEIEKIDKFLGEDGEYDLVIIIGKRE